METTILQGVRNVLLHSGWEISDACISEPGIFELADVETESCSHHSEAINPQLHVRVSDVHLIGAAIADKEIVNCTSGNHFWTPPRGVVPFVYKTPPRGLMRAAQYLMVALRRPVPTDARAACLSSRGSTKPSCAALEHTVSMASCWTTWAIL